MQRSHLICIAHALLYPLQIIREPFLFYFVLNNGCIKHSILSGEKTQLKCEDTEIIQKVRSGDTNAYRVLVRKYHSHLLNFIYRIIRDKSEVEDIGQEVFISVFRSLSDFSEKRGVPFSAWLFIIARNRCISELRKKKWSSNQL